MSEMLHGEIEQDMHLHVVHADEVGMQMGTTRQNTEKQLAQLEDAQHESAEQKEKARELEGAKDKVVQQLEEPEIVSMHHSNACESVRQHLGEPKQENARVEQCVMSAREEGNAQIQPPGVKNAQLEQELCCHAERATEVEGQLGVRQQNMEGNRVQLGDLQHEVAEQQIAGEFDAAKGKVAQDLTQKGPHSALSNKAIKSLEQALQEVTRTNARLEKELNRQRTDSERQLEYQRQYMEKLQHLAAQRKEELKIAREEVAQELEDRDNIIASLTADLQDVNEKNTQLTERNKHLEEELRCHADQRHTALPDQRHTALRNYLGLSFKFTHNLWEEDPSDPLQDDVADSQETVSDLQTGLDHSAVQVREEDHAKIPSCMPEHEQCCAEPGAPSACFSEQHFTLDDANAKILELQDKLRQQSIANKDALEQFKQSHARELQQSNEHWAVMKAEVLFAQQQREVLTCINAELMKEQEVCNMKIYDLELEIKRLKEQWWRQESQVIEEQGISQKVLGALGYR